MKVTKNNKAAATLTLLCGAASLSQAALPLYFPNENSYLTLSLATNMTYVDNIYASKVKVDDLIFNTTPVISVETGKDAINHFRLSFSETFVNYLDNNVLDTQLASARMAYTYDPRRRLRLHLDASFDQFSQNDTIIWDSDDDRRNDLREIIRRDYYTANIDTSYDLSTKLDLSLGFNYSNEQFNTLLHRYNDRQNYSVPVSLSYQIDKVYLGVSYSYSHTNIERALGAYYDPGTQTSHFVGLSTRGSFSSKLSLRGNVGIGFQSLKDRYRFDTSGNRSFMDDDSYSTLNFTLSADYLLSEKFRLLLTSGRNFQVGGRAQNLTNTYVKFNLNGYFNAFWQFNAYTSYAYQDFSHQGDRVDQLLTFGAAISYLPVNWARISLSYRYLQDESNKIADFNINTIMLTFDIRL